MLSVFFRSNTRILDECNPHATHIFRLTHTLFKVEEAQRYHLGHVHTYV